MSALCAGPANITDAQDSWRVQGCVRHGLLRWSMAVTGSDKDKPWARLLQISSLSISPHPHTSGHQTLRHGHGATMEARCT